MRPQSKLNALTILSAEQQVMIYYMNVGPQYMEPIARQPYQEISLIDVEQEYVNALTSRCWMQARTGGANADA